MIHNDQRAPEERKIIMDPTCDAFSCYAAPQLVGGGGAAPQLL